jgi:CHASE2 domain-containing sensor protein
MNPYVTGFATAVALCAIAVGVLATITGGRAIGAGNPEAAEHAVTFADLSAVMLLVAGILAFPIHWVAPILAAVVAIFVAVAARRNVAHAHNTDAYMREKGWPRR